MTETEISVLRHLQYVRSRANYRNNKLNGTVTRKGKSTSQTDASVQNDDDSAAKEATTDNWLFL